MSIQDMYDFPKDMYNAIFTGDTSQIPSQGTLVAMDTASRGLVNVVTTGKYALRKSPVKHYYDVNEGADGEEPEYREDTGRGSFLVSVEVVYADGRTTNTRFIDDLSPPLTVREEMLLKENLVLRQALEQDEQEEE